MGDNEELIVKPSANLTAIPKIRTQVEMWLMPCIII